MTATALGMPVPRVLDRRYGYHLARHQALLVRALHAGPLRRRLLSPVESPAKVDAHVIAFSSERDALEQLVSLRTLLRHLGRPARFTLGSDGTHSERSLDALRRLYPQLEVLTPSDYLGPRAPAALREYAAEHPMGKKLAFMDHVRPEATAVYADSDVLFFPGATDLRRLIADTGGPARYLPDCARSLDEHVVPSELATAPPVNAGFWIAHRSLAWDDAVALLDGAAGAFTFHTEQTVFHVAMHRAGAVPLDPERYVMQVDDQFDYRTERERGPIALRHYVRNIRHHLWLNASL